MALPHRTIVVNVQTEQVIQGVKERPVLWDTTHRDHKDTEMRLTAWREICEELIQGFGGLSRQLKKAAVKKIQQRWRTARDSYTKTKTSMKKSRGAKVKVYIHHDLMTFLDHSTDDRVDYNATDESEDDETTTDPLMPEQDARTKDSVKRKLDVQSSPPDFDQNVDTSKRNTDMVDEDWSFFNSMMPTLNKFTNLQKLKFRSKVLNFLIEVEQGSEFSSNADCSFDDQCSSSNVKFEK